MVRKGIRCETGYGSSETEIEIRLWGGGGGGCCPAAGVVWWRPRGAGLSLGVVGVGVCLSQLELTE